MSELTQNPSRVYSILGKYIQEKIFGNDVVGEVVFPIIDVGFIEEFCKSQGVGLSTFISSIQRTYIYSISRNSSIQDIIGFIGVQLYAASKMENSSGFSVRNYRDRICGLDVLNIELNEWQQWVNDNQDDVWRRYYDWCDSHYFYIANKCTSGFGTGRYVQYPKQHSALVLNREDLKRIASVFVEKGLQPNEQYLVNFRVNH